MLYLASNSPRRRELLALAGLPFERLSPVIDETPLVNEAPEEYVLRLAREKAQAAAVLAPAQEGLILAADTTVAFEDRILGKPADAAEAREMLSLLRGHTHQVYTAIALLRLEDELLWAEVALSNVSMRAYTPEEMEAYIACGDPFDKAGAYAIQHKDFHPVEHFNECYANVMGLPLCHLVRALRAFEVYPPAHVPQGCQAALTYSCPIYATILGVG